MGGLPACDRVEVFLLGGVSERPQRGQFPIVPYKTTSGIEGMRILRGPDAEALTALWRGLDFDPSKRAMCHEPHYGLRFYGGGKLRLQTSVCWGCRNFYVEDRWEGFDAKSESGQRFAPAPADSTR